MQVRTAASSSYTDPAMQFIALSIHHTAAGVFCIVMLLVYTLESIMTQPEHHVLALLHHGLPLPDMR
eukprot:10281-Heterococcus_DN1.PRE.2